MSNGDFLNNNMMQGIDQFSGGRGNVRVLVDNRVTYNYNGTPQNPMGLMMPNPMALTNNNAMPNMLMLAAMMMSQNNMNQSDLQPQIEVGHNNGNGMQFVGSNHIEIEDKTEKEEGMIMNEFDDDLFENTDPVNNKYYITNSSGRIYKEPNKNSDQHVLAKMVIPKDLSEPITIFTLNTNMITTAKEQLNNSSHLRIGLNDEWTYTWFKELILHARKITKRTGRNYIFLVEENAEVTDIKYPMHSKVYSNHSLISTNVYMVEFQRTTDTVVFNF